MPKRTSQQSSSPTTLKKATPITTLTRSQRQAGAAQERRRNPRRQKTAVRPPLQCPKCGTALQQRNVHGVPLDACPQCGGLWVDKDAVAKAAKAGGDNWLGHVVVDLGNMMAHTAPLQPEGGLKKWYWY